MKNELDEKQLRAKQYWYVDGTYEFNMGGIFLLLTPYFLLLAKFEGTKFGAFLSVIMVFIFVGGIFGVGWLIRQLKSRITFPRTGYVSYKRERGKKRITRLAIIGGVAGGIAALISLAIIKSSAVLIVETSPEYSLNWLPGLTGLLMAVAATIFGIRMHISRFYGIAVLSIIIGVATMFVPASMNIGLALYYGIMSIALFIIGGFVFSAYLRATAPPTEVKDE